MYSEYRSEENEQDLSVAVMDDLERMEFILDALCSGELSEWVAEAAQMAVAEHLRLDALEDQSAFESEHSER